MHPPIFIRWHRKPFFWLSWQRDPVSIVIAGLEVSFPRWRLN